MKNKKRIQVTVNSIVADIIPVKTPIESTFVLNGFKIKYEVKIMYTVIQGTLDWKLVELHPIDIIKDIEHKHERLAAFIYKDKKNMYRN